jgi:hypothetical protein
VFAGEHRLPTVITHVATLSNSIALLSNSDSYTAESAGPTVLLPYLLDHQKLELLNISYLANPPAVPDVWIERIVLMQMKVSKT